MKSNCAEPEKTTERAVKRREELFSRLNIESTLHAQAEDIGEKLAAFKGEYPQLVED